MSLSKGKKSDAFFDALRQEEQLVLPAAGSPAASASASAGPAAAPVEERRVDTVKVTVEEQVVVSLERDGALRKMEVKGEMKLSIADPDLARLVVVCAPPERLPGIQYRPHPKIDAKAWTADSQLALKDRTKPFPVGSDNATGILKWRFAAPDDSYVPLSVNFWPSSENGRSVVSVEFSVPDDLLGRGDTPFVLGGLTLSLPCPSRAAPEVSQCDGDWSFSARDGRLAWQIGDAAPEPLAAWSSASPKSTRSSSSPSMSPSPRPPPSPTCRPQLCNTPRPAPICLSSATHNARLRSLSSSNPCHLHLLFHHSITSVSYGLFLFSTPSRLLPASSCPHFYV
jgi:hypothetical protein